MYKGLRMISGLILLLGLSTSALAADRNVLFEMFTNTG